jgi:hypothetical protein
MKITFRYRHLASLLLFASGTAAQGHSPTTDAPAFIAQGAFVAIVVIAPRLSGSSTSIESQLTDVVASKRIRTAQMIRNMSCA